MPVEIAPYDQHGNLMHYPQDRYEYSDADEPAHRVRMVIGPDWRPNSPFVAELTFSGEHRGRSAAYFEWVDTNGRRWPMFMTDIGDLIRNGTIVKGSVLGRWVVAKRGKKYGLRLATAKDGD